MSTLESFFASLGLLWERLHIISAGTVQSPGATCMWTQDLVPIGSRVVPAGELVELRVTLDKDHPLADATTLRFDILEFDWLFSGGFDDPVSSLKPPAAPAPSGDFVIDDRLLSEAAITDDLPTLRAVVDDYRIRHFDDYERGILVVRGAPSGATEIVAWWRARYVAESGDGPSLYFIAEIPGQRASSTEPLRVAPPAPGVNVRMYGEIRDVEPAALVDAQPVPDAVLAVAGRTAHTTALGEFVLDVRLPLGQTTCTIGRPGIDQRTLSVSIAGREDHGFDMTVLDADAANAVLASGSLAPDATDQDMVRADLTVRARVHRLSGQVLWPQTWNPAAGPIPLTGRWVCAVPLAPGAALAQRPQSSRDWEALRQRPDVLRSARPGRPRERAATDASGRFEISFVDLRAGNQYLLWVEGQDPRTPGARSMDVIVRTVAAPSMRRLEFSGAGGSLNPETVDRRAVDSTYNLLADSGVGALAGTVAGATEVIRVIDAAPTGSAAPDLRLLRPGRADPAGFDATPVAGTDSLDVADLTKSVQGLQLEVLPLVPVFETADRQGDQARWALSALREQLDAHYPRGYLLGGLRWVLDARRGPTAAWDDAAACAALETTLLTHPRLSKARVDDPRWPWWRTDTVSAADFARPRLGAGNLFAGRRLIEELAPILLGPAPRLLGLFGNRHVHISPGHGVYCQPATSTSVHTNRGDWAGTAGTAVVQNWAGEDENTGALGIAVRAAVDANAGSITVSRESLDPTRLGYRQNGGAFAEVDPVALPHFPRLWQQNAYYWIAADWDAAPIGATIVRGHAITNNASVDAAGINSRLELFRREAGVAGRPIDAFLAIHTNGSAAVGRRGLDVMYLDIRPTPGTAAAPSLAPGDPGYVEGNQMGLDSAARIAAAIGGQVQMPNGGAVSYWAANGSIATELNSSTHHFRDGTAVRGMRALVNNPAGTLNEVLFPPPAGGPDHPVSYLELGFHSNAEDAHCLSQGWFRYAAGVGIAVGLESVVSRYSSAVTGDDLAALLERTFGAIPSVAALPRGAATQTTAQIEATVQAVSGRPVVAAGNGLADVVSLIEVERAVVNRGDLARRIADAAALRAGWTAEPSQAVDRARAVYGPVLRALGAPTPAGDAAPDINGVPLATRPPTRADAAAALAAALGIAPATLPAVTAAINGVTVLDAAVPESPEAFLPGDVLERAVTQIGRLRPIDIWRPAAVRLLDDAGNALSAPPRVVVGQPVVFALDMRGTAWRGDASDVTITVSRGGSAIAQLACTERSASTLLSAAWTATAAAAPGPQTYQVSARIRHHDDGPLRTAAIAVSLEVQAPPAGGGAP